MLKPKIGLLPLYLELYDRVVPNARPRIEEFYSLIASEIERRGVDVVRAEVGRVASEFDDAVKAFEEAGVDAIVTLHLAYSPSLEAADVLASTKLPIIMLDTTPTFAFGPRQDAGEIMYNHGIHGVQDLCNILIRHGKPFEVVAGHWERSNALDRVVMWSRAAKMASAMRSARVGRIGDAFAGMGDFSVSEDALAATIGLEVVACDFMKLRKLIPEETDREVRAEIKADSARFINEGVDKQAHLDTTRACLGVRRWIEDERLTAFTFNFDAIDESTGLPTVPFLEASKAMARGVGYAGEGDVLTASLIGALASEYPETTFTEMFCADWQGNRVFVSHMGELNIDLTAGEPVLLVKDLPYLNVKNPAFAVGRLRRGRAVLVNLAPGPENTYKLIVSPVKMLDVDEDKMTDTVRGWFSPPMPLTEYLEEYSWLGGTHHSALVYYGSEERIDVRDTMETIIKFGVLMGWNVAALE